MRLNNQKVGSKGGKLEEEKVAVENHSELSIGEDEERQKMEEADKDCCGRCWIWLNTRGKDKEGIFRKMHLSSFAFYRECTVAVVISLLYFLVFFLPYISGFFGLISTSQLLFPAFVSVLGQNHRVIITNYDDLNKAIAAQGTLSSLSQVSDNMGCLIDDTGAYYSFFKPTSPHWYSYLVASFFIMVIIIVLKGIQAGKFSLARALYHHYDSTIDGVNQSRFAASSYVFFQLWYFLCLYAFFTLFNFIFLEQT